VKPRGRPQPRAQPGGISSTRSLCLVTYQPADGEASTTVRLKLVAASCVGALTG
jgi:hypothetical protein